MRESLAPTEAPLAREQIRAITEIPVRYLSARPATRGIGLDLTEAALDRLGEAGFDPVYGARPLERAIQQQLENPLAQAIPAGRFVPGDTVRVDVTSDGFHLDKASPGVAAA